MMLIRACTICGVLALLAPISRAEPALQLGSTSCKNVQAGVNEAVVKPLAIRLTNPAFSSKVKKKRMHGEIVLSVTIATDGTVKDVSVVSSNPAVADSAVEAVRRWRYLPAMRDGRFIETTQEVTIHYDFGKNASPAAEQEAGSLSEPPQNLLQDLADGKLFRVGTGTGVAPPGALSAPDAEYTEEARRDRISGRVLLCVVVGIQGEPRNVWVARPLGHGLDGSAVEAVKHWKFSPAIRNGESVAAVVNVESSFDIY